MGFDKQKDIELWQETLIQSEDIQIYLDLFLMCYNQLLVVMERDEFLNQKNPFEINTLIPLISVIKSVFFQCLKNEKTLPENNKQLLNNMRTFIVLCQQRNMQTAFIKDENIWLLPKHDLQTWRDDYKSYDNCKFARNILNTIPYVIPFNERVEIMKQEIKEIKDAIEAGPSIKMYIRRNNMVSDGLTQTQKLGQRFRSKIRISFVNEFDEVEQGIDAGGVFKEFLEMVTRQVCVCFSN